MGSLTCTINGIRYNNAAGSNTNWSNYSYQTSGNAYVGWAGATGVDCATIYKFTVPTFTGKSTVISLTMKIQNQVDNGGATTLNWALAKTDAKITGNKYVDGTNYPLTGNGEIANGTVSVNIRYASYAAHTFAINTSAITAGGTYYLIIYRSNNTGLSVQYPSSIILAYKSSYTITYNANGGSGAPSAGTKYENETYTISSTKPTKQKTTSTVNGSFKIFGQANGGYFGSTSVTSTSITATTSRTDTTTYTFKNWNTNSAGTGTSYSSGGSYTGNNNLALYAQYTSSVSTGGTSYSNNKISTLTKPSRNNDISATYTVAFKTKGGSNLDSSLSVNTTRTWNFGGWATSANSSSANASATYTSATTLYAYWTYTDTKGKITLPSPGNREGYEFLGWGTSENQTTGLLAVDSQVEVSSNITYYAIWKASGAIRIYKDDANKFSLAQVYVWNGLNYSLVTPYVYTEAGWKILG